MLNVVNFQINVELGSVQVKLVKQFYVLYRAENLIPEVRIIRIAEEIFLTLHKKPDAEWRYVLNAYGNALSTVFSIHEAVSLSLIHRQVSV